MTELDKNVDVLLDFIKQSREYSQYQYLLARIKEKEDLKSRISEFRKRSLQIRMQAGEDSIQAANQLDNDFADIKNNGLVQEFFAAEHEYCNMIKDIQSRFLEGVDIDTSFLD